MVRLRLIGWAGLGSIFFFSMLAGAAEEGSPVRFRKVVLDPLFRSEGVAVGDYNRDGKLDIAAGYVWFAAPDWKMYVISAEPPVANGALRGAPPHYDPTGYANSFCNFAEDLNGDGWTDLIVVDFPGTPTWWFENPRGIDRPWTRHVLTPVTNNESPDLLDLDGDGQRELIAAFSPDPQQPDGPNRQMAVIKRTADPTAVWQRQAVSVEGAPGTRRYSHGLGVGDINGDGRKDIVSGGGWWEAPEKADGQPWKFHAAIFGEPGAEGRAAHIGVQDFDGDGDADLLATSPHAFGIWWHEQQSDGQWQRHLIDNSFSQTHAVCMADINGDGMLDFVTGKRWWAHAKGDPGGDQAAVFCWFEFRRENGKPVWIRHQFDDNSGPGTHFEVADVNGDGRLDIVASSKKGVHYFEQIRP